MVNVIAAAHVTVGRDRWGHVRNPTPVDKDGKYTVVALKPVQTWVTVEAPEFVPQTVQIKIDAKVKPFDFDLKPGYKLY